MPIRDLDPRRRGCSDRRRTEPRAAGTVSAEGDQVPEGVLVAAVPGKFRREVSEAERASIERYAATYVGLSRLHCRGGA